jgi:predicted DNA-binding transcriptional regulator AlpA
MGEKAQCNRGRVRNPSEFERLADTEARTRISGAEFRRRWSAGLDAPRRYKVGRMVLLRRAEVDSWIESHLVSCKVRA